MKISVIVPSLNPDEKLLEVVKSLKEKGFNNIILVDDGSDDSHKMAFNEAAKYDGVSVLVHEVNKGKGRALKTAFEYFLKERPEYDGVVTVDGDNQHKAEDVLKCCEAMISNKSLILGVRDFSRDDIPARSKFGNNLTSGIFKTFCKLNITDTQTGLRAIPREFIKDMLEVKGERYEYETNMLLALKSHNIPFMEVGIQTVYIDENESSHFNPIKDSIKIYKVIFAYFFTTTAFKYTLCSISSWVIDNLLFNIFSFIFVAAVSRDIRILLATVIARIMSSFYNYLMNAKLVFKSQRSMKTTFIKYYILWIGIMLCSFLLVDLFTWLLGLNLQLTALCKIIVDLCLFFASYNIQKKWVFK
ncbi:MAG: bifunctional glycosyltransferase family 2/GtrA family protein [Lachnospira sp.]|nr:bifunctional glycosyltransferase family 2/GtrA family protein [Lachnospira sp.]